MTRPAESREHWVTHGWCSDEISDVAAVTESINEVYARFNRSSPHIVWCDSPWQLATVPFIMNLVCIVPPEFQSNGQPFLEAVREQLDYLDQPLWQRAAQCVKDHLSAEIELSVQNGRSALYDRTHQRVSDAISKRLSELKTVDGTSSDLAIPARQRATFQMLFQAGTGIDIKRLGVSDQSENNLPEIGNEQKFEEQLRAENDDVFLWDLGKFSHPWAMVHIGSQLQEQLREPFREYVGHILALRSLMAVERGAPWQQPPDLNPLPIRRDPRYITWCRKNGPGLAPKFVGPLIEGERYGLAQESANLKSHFGGTESTNADLQVGPSHRLFSSDYELLWGSWATEVLSLLLDLEERHESQHDQHENQKSESDEDLQEVRDYWNLCQGAFMYVLEPEIVYACRKPKIHLDELGHFHSQDQAAIEFPDGYGFHFLHGTLTQETN